MTGLCACRRCFAERSLARALKRAAKRARQKQQRQRLLRGDAVNVFGLAPYTELVRQGDGRWLLRSYCYQPPTRGVRP